MSLTEKCLFAGSSEKIESILITTDKKEGQTYAILKNGSHCEKFPVGSISAGQKLFNHLMKGENAKIFKSTKLNFQFEN